MMKIAIFGAGYVGLTTSVHLAERGHAVCCVENQPEKRRQIEMGQVPWFEPGLTEALQIVMQTGRWSITDSVERALEAVELVIVAVGTPEAENGSLDLSAVERVVDQVTHLVHRPVLIAIKSTVIIGTCRRLQQRIDAQKNGCRIVSWPEFLREGSALKDLCDPDRIVVGAQEVSDAQLIFSLDVSSRARGIMTTWEAAELGKMASNAFLATKIAFTHELAEICETTHVSVDDVAKVIGSDHRIGEWGLEAGIGFGGSCFPKDVQAFSRFTSADTPSVTREASRINQRQIDRLLVRMAARLHIGKETRVTVLGLAYKAETDDVRDSPSITLVKSLLDLGAIVTVHDPRAIRSAKQLLGERVIYAESLEDAVETAQVCVVLVGWRAYKDLSPLWFEQHLPVGCCVVDIRRIWTDLAQMKRIRYVAVGVDEKTYAHDPSC